MNAETKANLSGALVKALAEIEGAAKDKLNPHFKSKYADIGSVIDAIRPVLAKYDLGFTQHSQPSDSGVIVETWLHHASGETLAMGSLYVPANKQDAQGFGSALTYARRYALMTAFGVPAEDDDGNAASRSTGEATPRERIKLDGPHTSPTALQTAIKSFVGMLEDMGDIDQFNAYMQTPEVVALEKQAQRDSAAWWETGEGMPSEFEPVAARIHRKKRALEELEALHNVRTPIDAG